MKPLKPKPSYRKMSVREKERHNRMHEAPTKCDVCEMAVQPDDLLAHVAGRCQGRPIPGPRARWLTRPAALALGVAPSTLDRWVGSGDVRVSGNTGARRYLLRDLTKRIAGRKARPTSGAEGKPKAKQLTKQNIEDPKKDMGQPMTTELTEQLSAFAERVGGFAAAGRELKIPADTLRRAVKGERVRRGTVVLISGELAKVGQP